jgi:hypothetical protein
MRALRLHLALDLAAVDWCAVARHAVERGLVGLHLGLVERHPT